MEHITDYSDVLDNLWNLLNKDGILIISVPVKGWRDRNKEHVNKFTLKSMIKILSKYSDWINISPRTYSKKSGRLSTAYICVEKGKACHTEDVVQ